MPSLSSMTATTADPALNKGNFAGFWLRFCAACIDMLVYTPFYLAIRYAFGDAHRIIAESVFIVFGMMSYAWFFASKWQGSPGMYLLKFHICDTEGRRLSFGRALWWGVVNSIGWLFCFGGVIYLQSRFDIFAVNDLLQSCREQNIAVEDCIKEIESLINVPFPSFIEMIYAALGMTLFLGIIWALSIGLPKDKTGFNNLVCRTRFVLGRPS